jgi:hypothetical protein
MKNEKLINVSKYWLICITSEMALNYNTGLINSQGSPFSQFRKVVPDCPRLKKSALIWVDQLLKENEFKPTNYFTKTINKINETA